MTKRDYIPTSYLALASFLTNLVNTVKANMTRFGVDTAKVNVLQEAVNEYLAANAVAESPTASKVDRLLRVEKAAAAKKTARHFVNANLRYNDAVTNEDRLAMGLTVPDTNPTPIPAPTSYPVFRVDTSVIMRLTLHIRDNAKQTHTKPDGVHGCEIRWAILDTPPTKTEDLVHSTFSTRSSHTLEFEEPQRGKRFYFRGLWENPRGEKGPWGEIGNAIIP